MSSATVPRVQCSAMNKYNRRCLHFTNSSMYCWQHQKKVSGVRIAPSKIKGADMGLFAAKLFKKGDRISGITGNKVNTNREISGEHLYRIDRNKYIDAKKVTGAPGRYANDSREGDPGHNNARLVYSVKQKVAGLIAKEKIKPGKEIMADYGNHFFGKKYKYIKLKQINPLS
jgi:hypothetical protein